MIIYACTWLPEEKVAQAFILIPVSNPLFFPTDSASVACTTIPLISVMCSIEHSVKGAEGCLNFLSEGSVIESAETTGRKGTQMYLTLMCIGKTTGK